MENIRFSKLSRNQKIEFLSEHSALDTDDIKVLQEFWFKGQQTDKNLESISENVISHYYLPFSIAPGFLINNKLYNAPMVTDESSVVAAASAGAKFWLSNGGFNTRVISTTKIGQIHFNWSGTYLLLQQHIPAIRDRLISCTANYLTNMNRRGGGLKGIEFLDYTDKLSSYYQVRVQFNTADAMGANLINTCLEAMAQALKEYFYINFTGNERLCDILMSILSNYTPECLVESTVSCSIDAFQPLAGAMPADTFVQRFKQAVSIAQIDTYRAVTHNKGIFNGIDAVLIATGNDFRATEAGGHSYAAKDGAYKSLSNIEIDNKKFSYTLKMPLSIGTVGGLTTIHPLVRAALKILETPSAGELMQIAASVGLANNFSAIRALITSGIQQGHMRFQLHNYLQVLSASEKEKQEAINYFTHKTASFAEVETLIKKLRAQQP